jgi:predicted permease
MTKRFVILRRMSRESLRQLAYEGRIAVRSWTRRPGLATVALLTVALGIGVPTAMFSVIHAVLLQPLPYRDPERVVSFRMEVRGPRLSTTFDAIPASVATEWLLNGTTLSGISLYNNTALTLSTADGPYRLTGITISANGFEVLGVSPLLGRTFDPNTSDGRQVVLSYHTWQRFFAGRANVVNSPITLDGNSYRVTGVMPSAFSFPDTDVAFWVPLIMPAGGGRGMLLPAVGRVRPETALAAVEEEGRRLLGAGGTGPGEETLHAQTLHDQLVGSNSRLLWTLMGAVAMVSVIATTNIALLLLVRGASRAREFSIRLATGARRGRLLRQLIVEATMLATAGGIGGIALAALLLGILLQFAPPEVARLQNARINTAVLLFASALIAAVSVLFGVISAGRAVTVDIVRAMAATRGESSLPIAGPARRRLNVLVAAEIMLTVVLLVGAGLLLRSFLALLAVDYGFNADRTLAMQLTLPSARYPTPADRLAFEQRLVERLAQLPNVNALGVAITMPNRQPSARNAYDAAGPPNVSDPSTLQVAETRTISEGFIEAMGIPLLAGRTFRASDTDGAEPVIMISERLARLHFGGTDPIGRLLYSGGAGTRRVIGVIGDVVPASRRGDPAPSAYLPLLQDLDVFTWFGTLSVVIRGDEVASLAPTLRALVLSLDPEMPPFNVRTLRQELAGLVAAPRFSAAALVGFACIALVLAAVGLYGVVSYAAGQRTREFGVRVALGATERQVLWLVMREGLVVIALGLSAGTLTAVWLAQTIAGLLHNVRPADPLSLFVVATLLALVGVAAIVLPAYRATRVNAVEALRSE